MSWIFYLFLTILTWGGYNILFKFATNKINFALLLLIAGMGNALTALPWVLFIHKRKEVTHYSTEGIGIAVFMGLLMTLGGITYFYAFRLGAPVSKATPIYSIGVLLLSAIVGVFLKEPLTLNWTIGMLLGVVSIILITIK